MLPLALLGDGQSAEIVAVVGAGTSDARVEDMGLRAGRRVEMLGNGAGPVLVKVDESRIAVARSVAMRIQVRIQMTSNLAQLAPGQSGVITGIGTAGPLRRRLMDMGVLPGEEVRVDRVAPLGDPISVRVRSYELSLRKSEAEAIAVEVAP